MRNLIFRDKNARISALKYLSECKELKLIYRQEGPWAIGFVTEIGKLIHENWNIEELFIDSTYKTNNEGLELFGILAFCMGTGFPIAYFLLEPGTKGTNRSREQSLTGFFLNLRKEFPNLKPSFFFTDKESSQIIAIQNTFYIYPTICLWHIKRAVKRKIGEAKKQGKSSFTDADEKDVLGLIDNHFFRSTLLFQEDNIQLYKIALKELNDFFLGKNECVMHNYFLDNWYTFDWWMVWGRRSEKGIPFS